MQHSQWYPIFGVKYKATLSFPYKFLCLMLLWHFSVLKEEQGSRNKCTITYADQELKVTSIAFYTKDIFIGASQKMFVKHAYPQMHKLLIWCRGFSRNDTEMCHETFFPKDPCDLDTSMSWIGERVVKLWCKMRLDEDFNQSTSVTLTHNPKISRDRLQVTGNSTT